MPKVKLTDRFCAHAKAAAGEYQTDYFDEATRGLVLRVASSGNRTWYLFSTDPGTGKRFRKSIGSYPEKSLADARGVVLGVRSRMEDGEAVAEVFAPPPPPAVLTVNAALDLWYELHVLPNRRSADEVRKRLQRHVRPVIGHRELGSIRRGDVLAITDRLIAAGTPREANLTFEHLRAFLNWCVARDHLEATPLAGTRMPAKETPRERTLTDEEIRTMWTALPSAITKSDDVPRIVRLCLLTGQRVGEVSGMARAELDLRAREWTIPAERSKNGSAHVVPLSGPALEIVKEALASGDGRRRYVFPSDKLEDGPITPLAVARTLARALAPDKSRPLGRIGLEPFTCHDLRRTALTGMARLGCAPVVVGAVANHLSTTRAGITGKVYVRYSYAKEKREALELWGDHVSALVDGAAAEVVPLRRRK